MDIRAIDQALVAQKWVPISPWWWETIERVEAHPLIRNIVIRAGRRAGKSTTIAKIAVEALTKKRKNEFGEEVPFHFVPPGDVGFFAIISADKDQAKKRLDSCSKALTALGILHRKTAEEITLDDINLGIKCFAASLTAVVSFTCIGALCDEVARWEDKDSGANPANEIITSLRPTIATVKTAKLWFVSAPWSTLDEHHKMFEAGDSESQLVFYAPTWVANPTLTEAETHALEPDEQSWEREYKAIPMSSDEKKFFAGEFIDAAHEREPPRGFAERTTSGGDFAFRRDAAAMVALGLYSDGYSLRAVEERVPGVRALRPSDTIKDLAQMAVAAGADSIACDLHYIETVREHVEDLPIELLEYPSQEKEKWYVKLRVMLGDGTLNLGSAPPELIAQLKAVVGKPLDTGRMKIEVKRSAALRHGDLVDALVCAVWAHHQPRPEKKMLIGERRFVRDRHGTDDANSTMRDLPDGD